MASTEQQPTGGNEHSGERNSERLDAQYALLSSRIEHKEAILHHVAEQLAFKLDEIKKLPGSFHATELTHYRNRRDRLIGELDRMVDELNTLGTTIVNSKSGR